MNPTGFASSMNPTGFASSMNPTGFASSMNINDHYCDKCQMVNCPHLADRYVYTRVDGKLQTRIIRKPRKFDPIVEMYGNSLQQEYHLLAPRK